MILRERAANAIDAGLAALASRTTPELLVGFDLQERYLDDPAQRARPIESPFGSAFVLSALAGRSTARTRSVALRFVPGLLDAVEPSGLCRFCRKWSWPVPPDADDTACVLAALKAWEVPGVDYRDSLDHILANRDDCGRLRTWFFEGEDLGRRELGREADVVVTTNVLFYAALMGRELPREASLVSETVRERGFEAAGVNSYYPYPVVFCYFLIRWLALADGFGELRASARELCLERSRGDGSPPLDAALLLTCLARLGGGERGTVDALAARIVDAQLPSGLWPPVSFCGDPRGKAYGSPQVTTAACLEALAELTALGEDGPETSR